MIPTESRNTIEGGNYSELLESTEDREKLSKIYCLTISTGRLNTLLCFHRPPINLVIFKGSSQPCGCMRSNLGDGFPLRCFQRLSDGNIATQRCSAFTEQLAHQGFPHPSPLVLGTNLLKSQTDIQDRDRTVLRRSDIYTLLFLEVWTISYPDKIGIWRMIEDIDFVNLLSHYVQITKRRSVSTGINFELKRNGAMISCILFVACLGK